MEIVQIPHNMVFFHIQRYNQVDKQQHKEALQGQHCPKQRKKHVHDHRMLMQTSS